MTFNSRLDPESEKKLLKLFDQNVSFRLLYKGSHFDFDFHKLFDICSEQGSFILTVYYEKHIVGGFLKKSLPRRYDFKVKDEDAFVFSLYDWDSTATRFSVKKGYHAFQRNYSGFSFGDCLKVVKFNRAFHVDLCSTYDFNRPGWSREKQLCEEVELYRVQAGDLLPGPWRDLTWTETNKDELRKNLVSYEPPIAGLTRVRVLLLGPVGAGKFSFINSIKSALYGNVVNLPGIGATPDGFIKKLKSYPIRAENGQPIALTLCNVRDIGDSEETGLSLHDALAIIKGHAPEGYKFQSGMPINPSSVGYCLDPGLQDKIHCVVFVLNACSLHSYGESLVKMIKKFRREISDLDVPQLVLLTHVDEVCHAVNMDIRYIYTSRIVQKKVQEAASLTDVPVSFVLPVKNYMSELTVNRDTDILIFIAVQHILYAIDDMFEA